MMKPLSIIAALTLLGSANEQTAFGDQSFETGFSGFLYDLKQDMEGETTEVGEPGGSSFNKFYDAFEDLIRKKFSDKELGKYRIADETNSLKYFAVPSLQADQAPTEFGSSYIDPKQIIMVYKGTVESAPAQELRFGGVFDDAMCVLVNGKVVFYISRHEDQLRYKPKTPSRQRKKEGVNYVGYGDYIRLKKGDEVTLVAAEIPGGQIGGHLLVQLKNYQYDLNSYKDPIVHPFVCDENLTENELLNLQKLTKTTIKDLPIISFQK